MTYNSESQVYYYKFLELQEKLRKSEEDRLKLEIKLNEMIQKNREEEQQYYQTLKSQYKDYMKSDTQRILRNEQILQALEKIEMKISLLSAKTQRFKSLRRHYQAYWDKTNSVVRDQANMYEIPVFIKEKRVPEKPNEFPVLEQDEKEKNKSFNHNYVYNYLMKNNQNANARDKPNPVLNEVLSPLYSFSKIKAQHSERPPRLNEGYQESQGGMHNVLLHNSHYNGSSYAPLTTQHQPNGYISTGLYCNQPKTEPESHFSELTDCGRTFENKMLSTDGHKNIIAHNTHNKDVDLPKINPHLKTNEDEINSNEVLNNNHDINRNALVKEIIFSPNQASNEYHNLVSSETKPHSAKEDKDNFGYDNEAKEAVLCNPVKEEEMIQQPFVRLLISEFSTEPPPFSNLDQNETVPNESIENQLDVFNSDLPYFLDKMPVPDQKQCDNQTSSKPEQKDVDENIEISSDIEPNMIYTDEVEGASNQNELPVMRGLSYEESSVEQKAETSVSDVNKSYQNEVDDSIRNEFNNLPHGASELAYSTSEVLPTTLQEPVVNITLQDNQYELENQNYYQQGHNLSEPNQDYELMDQLQAFNKHEYSTEDQYPQYARSGEELIEEHVELSQNNKVNAQELQVTSEKEQLQDGTNNFQEESHYGEEQKKQFEEDAHIADNQTMDPNNQFQAYGDDNEQYLPSDQYPLYGQSEDPANYDPNILAQNYNENEQPYNVQYNEQDLSYTQYDENNHGYDQQYYGNEENYANYENGGQQYGQIDYDQYNQEGYPLDQQTAYEGHEEEQLDTNGVAPEGCNIEAEYNPDVLGENVVNEGIEPISQVENNGTGNMRSLVNILETDSENITDKSDVKVSNESDFDFSSNQ